MAGLLSVAVVVMTPLLLPCPHLLFREATLPRLFEAGSREVPLPIEKTSSGGSPFYQFKWLIVNVQAQKEL